MRPASFYFLMVLFTLINFSCTTGIDKFGTIDREPCISPDYTGIVIPPNIAPLNFIIKDSGRAYEVRITAGKGKDLVVRSSRPAIRFNLKDWHSLLQQARGGRLRMDVFVKNEQGNWFKFKTVENDVSNEDIDNHLAYRLINAGYILWSKLGIWQRDLENFDEKPILENESFEYGCLNCHSFCRNNPETMMLHTRAMHGGTVIYRDGKLSKIDTKNKYLLSAGVYPAWHPDGKHIAFSVNSINQHFSSGDVRIEVSDEFSDLVVYDIDKNELVTCPKISSESRENLPVWSADGKYLYFISAPPVTDLNSRIYSKYSLLRIGFDGGTGNWGEVDTILSANKTGKSISFPKVSPDGKFLMFCMNDYGYFTIHHPGADLYLLDLQTGNYRKMDINSPETDSYHCFSSTGHWFVFSSKRIDGLYTRPFFSHLDKDGNASKPFVLPQEDPGFYESFSKNYNIPELLTGPVTVSPLDLRDEVMGAATPAKLDGSVDTLYLKAQLAKTKK
jgi:hypothetical protein